MTRRNRHSRRSQWPIRPAQWLTGALRCPISTNCGVRPILHIFTRLGLWEDSITSNQAARQAAHEQGDLGEELYAMDYLTYAYLQRGRDAAMLQPLPDSAPHVASIVYWARAVANARAGRPQTADGDIAKIETCRQQEEATQLLRHAADEEEALEKLPVTPGPIIPAREQLGEMLLLRERPREALKEFRTVLVAAPRRRAALTGAIQAAELIGDRPMAEQMRADLASE